MIWARRRLDQRRLGSTSRRHTFRGLRVVLRFLRRHEELPQATDKVFVVNRRDELIGVLPVSRILVSNPASTVREIMITDFKTINAVNSCIF